MRFFRSKQRRDIKPHQVKVHIRKNDQVVVITGKDKGKIGKVLQVFPRRQRAIVEGVNIVKRHMKPTPYTEGGIVEKPAPVHISNLMVFCPKCNKGVKVGRKFLEDGTKVRVCKKCGEIIEAKE
ncbi:ribosomal protein L24 [Thermodesulfatator indicus DSM 15286]|uniref:Large ribosomal subunit protein uL24 n=1 Tax=Thermodesulfatator indicus (strain DSM 15286 / JCM 11887 / CIR29812) TaxID=667014 RepID=F8AA48_THEID|nr:50S ribosomal protein L24 [Thermodesulfatator indicus]AEH45336.1 ribosomal protein L24 [Thermodesulfatator indicus DSM 15286]